jgi:hypothetical protein
LKGEKMDRRDFLKVAAASAAGLVLAEPSLGGFELEPTEFVTGPVVRHLNHFKTDEGCTVLFSDARFIKDAAPTDFIAVQEIKLDWGQPCRWSYDENNRPVCCALGVPVGQSVLRRLSTPFLTNREVVQKAKTSKYIHFGFWPKGVPAELWMTFYNPQHVDHLACYVVLAHSFSNSEPYSLEGHWLEEVTLSLGGFATGVNGEGWVRCIDSDEGTVKLCSIEGAKQCL